MRFLATRSHSTSCTSRVKSRSLHSTSVLPPLVTYNGVTASQAQLAYLYNAIVAITDDPTVTPGASAGGGGYSPGNGAGANNVVSSNVGIISNDLNCTISIPGQPETPCPTNFTIEASESASAEWSMPFKSKWARHHPITLQRGLINGTPEVGTPLENTPLQPLNFWAGVMNLSDPMSVNVSYAGIGKAFSGFSSGYECAREGNKHIADFVWKGQDWSQKLFVPDITMPAVRNRLASSVAQEILDAAGVPGDLGQLYADDWVIPYMLRVKQRYIDFLMQILYVPVLEWKMVNGDTFTPYLPNANASTGTWSYPAGSVVRKTNDSANLQPVINRVIVRMQKEVIQTYTASKVTLKPANANNTLGPATELVQNPAANGTETSKFGEYTVNFSPPINNVRWTISASEAGIFSDFLFKGPSGGVVAVREPRAASSIPEASFGFGFVIPTNGTGAMYQEEYGQGILQAALNNIASVTFTWGQAPSGSVTPAYNVANGYGKIQFTGTRPVAVPVPQGNLTASLPAASIPTKAKPFSPDLVVTVDDFQSQANFGRIYTEDENANTMYDTIETATLHGQRLLLKTGRQCRESTWVVPLNAEIERGDNIMIEDTDLGQIRNILVAGYSHTYSTNPHERGTTVRGKEYFLSFCPGIYGGGTGGSDSSTGVYSPNIINANPGAAFKNPSLTFGVATG